MENTSGISLRPYLKKYDSTEATIEGPFDAKNDKQYYKAKFAQNTTDDGGYIGQSRDYTKLFFEDTHSRLFKQCEICLEENKPLKIMAGRIAIPTAKPFYITDEAGNKRTRKDGSFVTASSITMFLIADENPEAEFNRRCNQITNDGLWVKDLSADETEDDEERKAAESSSKKGAGKK